MPTIVVKEQFQIAVDNGNRVVTIEKGEQDVGERVALVAVEHLKVATLKKAGGKNANNSGAGEGSAQD